MRSYWVGILLSAVFVTLAFGCDRNPERRAALENLNNHPEIVQRGGVVKEIEMRDPQRGGVYPFRGDILDAEGNVIGTVNGARVEGFGTRINRIRWEGQEEGRRGGERRGRIPGGGQPVAPDAPDEAATE